MVRDPAAAFGFLTTDPPGEVRAEDRSGELASNCAVEGDADVLCVFGGVVELFAGVVIPGDVLKLDGGRGVVGIMGIGCLIIVGIVTVAGTCGNAGETVDRACVGGVDEPPEEFGITSDCDISNIFLALAMSFLSLIHI